MQLKTINGLYGVQILSDSIYDSLVDLEHIEHEVIRYKFKSYKLYTSVDNVISYITSRTQIDTYTLSLVERIILEYAVSYFLFISILTNNNEEADYNSIILEYSYSDLINDLTNVIGFELEDIDLILQNEFLNSDVVYDRPVIEPILKNINENNYNINKIYNISPITFIVNHKNKVVVSDVVFIFLT